MLDRVALISCRVDWAAPCTHQALQQRQRLRSRSFSTRKRGVSGTISMQMMSSAAGIAAEASMCRHAVGHQVLAGHGPV